MIHFSKVFLPYFIHFSKVFLLHFIHFSKVFMLQKYKNTCLRIVKAYKNASFCTARNEAFEGECETDYFLHYLHFSLFGFKIKPEDFHNVSAFRNEGSSLTSNEAGSISDAKLAKFFGLKKRRRKSQSSVMPGVMQPPFSRNGTSDALPISGQLSRMVSCPRSA